MDELSDFGLTETYPIVMSRGYLDWLLCVIIPDRYLIYLPYIQDYGGVVRPQEDNLDVIIVSENFKDLYERKYWSHPDIYVELPSFINDCIYKRKCEHNMTQQRPMGGSLRTVKKWVHLVFDVSPI